MYKAKTLTIPTASLRIWSGIQPPVSTSRPGNGGSGDGEKMALTSSSSTSILTRTAGLLCAALRLLSILSRRWVESSHVGGLTSTFLTTSPCFSRAYRVELTCLAVLSPIFFAMLRAVASLDWRRYLKICSFCSAIRAPLMSWSGELEVLGCCFSWCWPCADDWESSESENSKEEEYEELDSVSESSSLAWTSSSVSVSTFSSGFCGGSELADVQGGRFCTWYFVLWSSSTLRGSLYSVHSGGVNPCLEAFCKCSKEYRALLTTFLGRCSFLANTLAEILSLGFNAPKASCTSPCISVVRVMLGLQKLKFPELLDEGCLSNLSPSLLGLSLSNKLWNLSQSESVWVRHCLLECWL